MATTLKPERSQVFLILLLLAASLSLCFSFYLFLMPNEAAYLFLCFALLLFIGAIAGWYKSQSDTDLAQAHITNLTLPDGTSISADPRVLRSPQSFHALIQIVQETLSRKPLPNADALLDDKMQPIPNSEAAAKDKIDQINLAVQKTTDTIFDTFGLSDEHHLTFQTLPQDSAPPVRQSE